MLAKQIKSFDGFSLLERLQLLLVIPLRKLISKRSEKLIQTRWLLYRILEGGGRVSRKNKEVEVSFPERLTGKNMGFFLRKDSTDTAIFSEIIMNGGGDYKLLAEIAKKQGIAVKKIIDAGSNIGCSALFFRSQFPEAAILCVEADRENFSMLQRNIKLNHENRITALNRAFWHNNDELNFGTGIRGTREKELSYGVVAEGGTKIKGLTFTDCLTELSAETVDLLKIDIEGAEKELVEDKTGFQYMLDHTKLIAIELHPEVIDPLNFIDLLKENGFDHLQYGEITIGWKKTP